MGETRVDLQHLLEDLRDAYSGSIEESIITEVMANALDAGATTIALGPSSAQSALTIVDDGRGMQRRELARYHDIATSTKRRGEGIGFAGVGIKLGLLVSREVLTETRRGATHVASSWSLTSRYRAPWKWIAPPGLVAARGTAVRLTLTNPLSALLDSGFLEDAIRRHFEPLLDRRFDDILRRQYPHSITIIVDGHPLSLSDAGGHAAIPVSIRMARRRTPSAAGYLARSQMPLAADRAGVAISTFGKVIKRGWDWLGLTPAAADRISGLVEVPDLAECLTLNKNDFLRAGPRGAAYLAYRKALQEVVSRQLAEWGDAQEDVPSPRPVRLDRDLERVLEQLASEFPLLQSLVHRRPGGQKRLPMPAPGDEGPLFSLITASIERAEARVPADAEAPTPGTDVPPIGVVPPSPSPVPIDSSGTELPGTASVRRRAQYGLTIRFESRPDDDEPGRLVDSTIWVNDAHPAFQRASTSRSLGYHLAVTVALTLAPLAVDSADEHLFVTRFLAGWGQPPARPRRDRSRHAARKPRRGGGR